MSTLDKAIQIAALAHSGQKDKAGEYYILHPIRVMLRLKTEEEKITGILHDVIEDSDVTLEQLRLAGFSENILNALDCLTKKPGESRLEAAKRASQNPLAKIVKLADNAENSDLSRLSNPTEKDYQRLEEYRKVKEILLNS